MTVIRQPLPHPSVSDVPLELELELEDAVELPPELPAELDVACEDGVELLLLEKIVLEEK